MEIRIYCTDISEAILHLEHALEDKELQDEISRSDDGDIIYMPFGEIEV